MNGSSARVLLCAGVWLLLTARAVAPASAGQPARAIDGGEGARFVAVHGTSVDHLLKAAGYRPLGLDAGMPEGAVLTRRGDGWSVEHRDDRWVDGLALDLNRASVEALDQLPGVGLATAAAIVSGRPYTSVADLEKAHGIGPGSVRRIAPWVDAYAAPVAPRPVSVNCASLAELDGLPGIGPTLAQRLVDARPIRDFHELDAIRGIGPATLADLRDRVHFGACL